MMVNRAEPKPCAGCGSWDCDGECGQVRCEYDGCPYPINPMYDHNHPPDAWTCIECGYGWSVASRRCAFCGADRPGECICMTAADLGFSGWGDGVNPNLIAATHPECPQHGGEVSGGHIKTTQSRENGPERAQADHCPPESEGRWRHFPGVGMPDCPWCGEPLTPADDCDGRCVNGHEWWDEKPAAEELRRTYGIPCPYDHSEDGRDGR